MAGQASNGVQASNRGHTKYDSCLEKKVIKLSIAYNI